MRELINISMVSNEVNAGNSNVSGSEDTPADTNITLNSWFCWSESNMLMADQ